MLNFLKSLTRKAFLRNIGGPFDVIKEKEVFMKSVKLLLSMLAVTIVMASCMTTQSATDDDYANMENARRVGNRVYVDDPYYGTVVLERDPYTGRYYDVTNGYGVYRGGRSAFGWDPYWGNRNGFYRNRVYRNNNSFGNGSIQRQSPSQQEVQKSREDARKKILGN
jgi:hypothetical protein